MQYMIITGTRHGLGKFLSENFDCDKIDRKNTIDNLCVSHTNIIIHAAYNCKYDANNANVYDYYKDNILLTEKLVSLKCEKFIFISTCGVYETKDDLITNTNEDDIIDMNNIKSFYGITKLICESIIKNKTSNYLILRPTALLGKYSHGIINKLIDKSEISVSSESIYNFILYDDILRFIELAIKNDLTGIYNVCTNSNISLSNICNILNINPKFGIYKFITKNNSNNKIIKIFNDLNRTSDSSIEIFLQNII